MPEPLRVLIAEDSREDATLIVSELERAGFDVTSETVETAPALQAALARVEWDFVVSDFALPELDGWRALEIVRQTGKDIPLIILSGRIGEEAAADLMRAGASDLVLKDHIERFAPAVQRELRGLRLRREAARTRDVFPAAQEAVAHGAFLDQVVQQMPAGVIVAEAPSGRLLLANRRAVAVYGPPDFPEDWPSRMAALEARHSDGRPYAEHEYPLIRALGGEVVTAEEIGIRRGDGSRIAISVNAAPVRDRTGAIALVVLAFDDISERKQADRALQESRERYHALFEQMSEGFALHEIICDESGQPYDYLFLDINPAFERLTGLKREDVVGKTFREVLPGDDPYWVQVYGAVALTGEPVQFSRHSPVLDRHYEAIAYRPAPRQFAVVFMDVTDRKRMEESVRVNLTKYSVLFNSLPLGVTVSDSEGQILEANAEAERLLGLGKEEHTHRTIDGAEWRIVRPDGTPMPPKEFASVRALKEHRRVADVEMGIVKEDGEVTWISVTAEPVPLEGYGVVIAYTDITDRKQAEAAVRESEQRYRELVENANSAIIRWTPDGAITFFNEYAQDLFGYREEGVIGKSVQILVPETESTGRDLTRLVDDIVRHPERHVNNVNENVRRDGTRFWMTWTNKAIRDSNGEVVEVLAVGSDITELRLAERRALEAERARAELAETLVSEIGHRTKNNLAIVAGLLQMQLSSAQQADSAEELIQDAITRIMSFAALHEQMYQSRSDSVELLDALRRIAEINRRALAAEGVSVSVEGEPLHISPGLGANICVMANELLTNALKHGCLTDEPCEIRVTLSADESRLALSVWNTGRPIADDFDVRASARTGLDLVQSMAVEQYGGSFTLAPHRGGTLASVILDRERLLESP